MTTIVTVKNEDTSHDKVLVKQTGGNPDVILSAGEQTQVTVYSGNTFSVEEVAADASGDASGGETSGEGEEAGNSEERSNASGDTPAEPNIPAGEEGEKQEQEQAA